MNDSFALAFCDIATLICQGIRASHRRFNTHLLWVETDWTASAARGSPSAAKLKKDKTCGMMGKVTRTKPN